MATSVRIDEFTRSFPTVPVDHPDPVEHLRFLAEVTQNLLEGKDNATGEFTLTASQATTTLSDRRIGPASTIVWSPTTANAATGMTVLYVTAQGDGTATLNHANNAQTDRTYRYAVRG